MERYYAVGIPVGALGDDDYRYLYAAGKILGIQKITYEIWSYFQGGNTSENVAALPAFAVYNDEKGLKEIINEMARNGLIIPESRVTDFIPLRNGVGAGYQENGTYLIFKDRPHHVSQLPYLYWLFSDGRYTVEEITKRLQSLDLEVTDQDAKEAVLLLLSESVLFLSLEAQQEWL